jgi:SRSO17 transposase
VRAVGERGTLLLGWRLYLPEEWCDDLARRRRAKVPDAVVFETKPQLAGELCERAAGWQIAQAPILADCAYGDGGRFRTRLHTLERDYLLAVSAQLSVYGPETKFAVPERKGSVGRRRSVARPDRKPESLRALAERLSRPAWKTLPCRTTPAGEDVTSSFAFVRVVATNPVRNKHEPPRWEWLTSLHHP